MKLINVFKGVYCASILLLPHTALAEWGNVEDNISVTKSKPHYDRINQLWSVEVTITNNGSENMEGPFRLLIDTTNIATAMEDGITADEKPYFSTNDLTILPDESISVTAHFEADRQRLNFLPTLQNYSPSDIESDSDNDNVTSDLDLCPDTAAGDQVNGNGCSEAQLYNNGSLVELTVNGDFETSDDSGWISLAENHNGSFTVGSNQVRDGSFSGNLVANVPVEGGAASFPVIQQRRIGAGIVKPNAPITISFDIKGSMEGIGGVVFAELFSEKDTGGLSKSEILEGKIITPTDNWTHYSFTTTTGDDVSGGVTLQLKADCGSNKGCMVNAYFDNVSVKVENDTSVAVVPAADWTMVWNDEFDGAEIDLTKWEHEVNCNGGGNNEQQCYTSNPENSFIENGHLKIVAKPESGQRLPYSSARLRTKYKGDWKYGRVEVRAKPPRGQGSFPAIWMLPTDNVYGGWPHSGEIDIFESVNLKTVDEQGKEEAYVHGNLWYGSSWPNQSNSGAHYSLPGGENPADGFHTYAIEWEEGEIRWYVDDYLYQTQLKSEVNIDSDGDANGLIHQGWFSDYENEYHWDNSPFDQDFHLILNFAVGGNWAEHVNNGGINSAEFNATNAFEFDYVRVYECSANPNTGKGCATVRDDYLEPIENGGSLVNGVAVTPIKPSSGIATDLIVFENTVNENWPIWSSNEETLAEIVLDDESHEQVVEFSMGAAPAVVGFNISSAENPVSYDGLPMLNNGWLEFDLKLVTPPNNASANWYLKVEQGNQLTEAVIQIDRPTTEWQHYAIPLQTLNNLGLELNGIDVIMIFPDWGQGEGAVFRVDNLTILQGEDLGNGDSEQGPVVGEEILTNVTFDNGTDDWVGTGNVISEDGNNVHQTDVEVAGNSWDVNLSQPMALQAGNTYVLSFKAKASVARNIIAGLGLNSAPWTNVTETVSLTTEWNTYTYVLTTSGFGDSNSRVFFDLGAEVGSVFIDDVSVVLQEQASGSSGAEDEFYIASSTGNVDVNLGPSTIGEWSTGTSLQADVLFDGLSSWELTSSSNTPEQGNWGTVLAFQDGFFGDFSLFNRIELKIATSGYYDRGFNLAISANGVEHVVSLPVDQNISTWQTLSIDTLDIPLNLSSIDWMAVYGIGGQMGVSTINITDLRLVKDEDIAFDSETETDFVFIPSANNINSSLIYDGDNDSADGNIIIGEWSTGTAISSTNYLGLNAMQLTANGSWGAVLAFQGDISDGVNVDNYDVDMAKYTNIRFKAASEGAFDRYALSIVSKIDDNEVAQEVGFSLENQSEWTNIDIDLAKYGINLSNVNQMAVFGVYSGGSAEQRMYLSDMVLYDSGKQSRLKDSSDDKFVFFSSTGESSDLIWDGDDNAHNGNVTLSEWATGTTQRSDVIYNGLNAFELTKGTSWGAVLALMGDVAGDVQEYKLDVAKYETINLKIASQGAFSDYTINFIVEGAEFRVPLTVSGDWSEVTLNVADIPLNLSKLKQIAIYGVGGNVGDKIYITDLNISK